MPSWIAVRAKAMTKRLVQQKDGDEIPTPPTLSPPESELWSDSKSHHKHLGRRPAKNKPQSRSLFAQKVRRSCKEYHKDVPTDTSGERSEDTKTSKIWNSGKSLKSCHDWKNYDEGNRNLEIDRPANDPYRTVLDYHMYVLADKSQAYDEVAKQVSK